MEENKFIIECGSGSDTYNVILYVKNVEQFEAATMQVDSSKTGEALVAALIALPSHGIRTLSRHNNNNKQNDGPNGEPAQQEFSADGSMSRLIHFKNQFFTDTANGEPCMKNFYEDGKIASTTRYKPGLGRNDAADGEFAHLEYDRNGKLIKAESYQDDRLLKKFEGEEAIKAYLTSRKVTKTLPAIRFCP